MNTDVDIDEQDPLEIETAEIDGTTLIIRPADRSRSHYGNRYGQKYDVFRVETDGTETLLTVADPWSHRPEYEALAAFLSVRKQRLVKLMASRGIVEGLDYQYEDDYELIENADQPGRFVAVYGDETYHQVYVTQTVNEALDALSGLEVEEYCNVPEGIYDLDTNTWIGVRSVVVLRNSSVATVDPQFVTDLESEANNFWDNDSGAALADMVRELVKKFRGV